MHKKGNLVDFPSLKEKLTENAFPHPDFVLKIIKYLKLLCTSFVITFCEESCERVITEPGTLLG